MIGPGFQGLHSNPQAGQNPFKGWKSSGIKMCKEMAKANKAARATPECQHLEATFLAGMKAEKGLTEATAADERKKKRRKAITHYVEDEGQLSEYEDDEE